MKKRFTVMLEETVIKEIKNLNYSPSGLRELIEETLHDMTINEQQRWTLEERYQFDDK